MKRILSIAGASIREHSRRKLIVAFVVISLVITGLQIAYVVKFGSPGGAGVTFGSLISVGLLAQLAFVAALAVSIGNIGRPFSDGEAALVLARPVARGQYVLGRLFASVGLVAGLCLLMAVETQAVRLASGQPMSVPMWGYWGIQVYNLMIICALTTLISVFSSNVALVAISAFVVDRFSSGVGVFYRMSETGGLEGGLATALRIAWFLTPKSLSTPVESIKNEMAGGGSNAGGPGLMNENSPGRVAWSLLYLTLMVALTVVAVRRKEVRG